MSMDKAKKLVESDKVALIIGPINGGGTIAVAHTPSGCTCRSSTAWGPRLTAQSMIGRLAPAPFQVQCGYGGGIYAADVLHYKTAVALAADFVPGHLYNLGFKQAFEERGGKVIQEAYYPEGTTNMVPFLTALKQADVLVYWGTPGDCFAMFPQYKELNIKMPILQTEDGGVTSSPGMLQHLGKAAIGAVFGTSYLYNANYPATRNS